MKWLKRLRIKLNKALKNTGGFTLVELLVTTIIMLLAASVMVTGIATATKSFKTQMRNSESMLLFSTLRETIDYELTYTSGDVVYSSSNSNVYTIKSFYSPTFCQKDTTTGFYAVDDNGNLSDTGYIVLGEATSDSVKGKYIASTALYTYDTLAKVSDFKYVDRTDEFDYFTYTLSVYDDKGRVLHSETMEVRPMNTVNLVSG